MQIHELTQPKKTKLDEANPLAAVTGAVGSAVAGAKNVGTAIASPFKNAGAAYSNQQSTAKINSWADRAYRTWEGYVQKRLLPMDPAQKSSYSSGQDGKMKQDLLSFVQKVFFGNLDMNNITNHQEVMGVIDSMLPGATAPTTNPAGAIAQQRQQKLGAAAKVAQGQMAANMGAGAKATPVTTAASATAVPVGRTTPDEMAKAQAKWAALAKQQPVTEAVDKPGFLKLAQLAATAQQPTGQKQGQYNVATNTPPAGIGPIMKQAGINPAILQTLGQLTITSLAKKNNAARKTGNPAADALLTSLGFTLA